MGEFFVRDSRYYSCKHNARLIGGANGRFFLLRKKCDRMRNPHLVVCYKQFTDNLQD